MKWLLLLLVSSPIILFGQTRRKGADSVKAATAPNLQSIPALLGNNPGTRVESIRVFDSGEYKTIVVRVHMAKADTIVALTPLPAVKIIPGDNATGDVSTMTVPRLPLPVPEEGTIVALPPVPVVIMKTEDIVAGNVSTITVPRLPHTVAEENTIVSLPPLPVIKIEPGDIVAGDIGTIPVPPLPPPMAEPDTIIALAVLQLKTGDPVVIMDTIAVPPLPDVEPEIKYLPYIATVKLVVKSSAARIDAIAFPGFDERKMPVDEMHLSADGYSLLEKLEGFSPELYSLKDGGFTIGFGFFVPYGEGNKWDKGVTWEEAEHMIRQKVPAYEDQVKRYINVPLTQNEFDALTMLAYNLGGFSKATSIVNDVNDEANFDKLKIDWNRFVHSKAPGVTRGLINRRKDELGVKKYANYQPERKVQVLKIRN